MTLDHAEAQEPRTRCSRGCGSRRTPEPCALVIFGASGDLTHRKLFPALYALAFRQLLPEKFAILGVARTEGTDDEFRDQMEQRGPASSGATTFSEDVWECLAEATRYISHRLRRRRAATNDSPTLLNELDEERGTRGNRVYYFAVPPQAIADPRRGARQAAHDRGLDAPHHREAVRPRPRLGAGAERAARASTSPRTRSSASTTTSARRPSRTCWRCGSRTASSSRSGTASSSTTSRSRSPSRSGIEGRAAYYEQAGAIRDIFQNHLLQLVALTAMEPPIDFTAESVRNEKVKVLQSMHTPGPKHVVRGQYGPGYIEGKEVPGYRDEEEVAPDSMTDTFIAAKLYVDNWRWADTPFYVRAGKRLARRETTIAIQFKRAPHPPFEDAGPRSCGRTSSSCTSSRTRACRWRSAPRCPGGDAHPAPCTWTSSTAAPSAPRCRRRTSG